MKNVKKILTVVVPTYNAEKYLEYNLKSFCIEDILPDLEIIIVNDGSTDNSLEIAKKYVEKYPGTYKVISKKNGGHGSGINCGIQNAAGKYFKVVDADDWVEKEAFTKLVSYLKETDADLVYSGFLWAMDCGESSPDLFKKKAETKIPFKNVVYEKLYSFNEIASKTYIKMHNITIKTEALRKMRLQIDENCFYVDSEYITYPIPQIETIVFLSEFVYMYRIGRDGQSVSIKVMKRREADYSKVIESLLLFYGKLRREILCTEQKRKYVASIIARVIAGKYKILLVERTSSGNKKRLIEFDMYLKRNYPEIYGANSNKAIQILRDSKYSAYSLLSFLTQKKYQ